MSLTNCYRRLWRSTLWFKHEQKYVLQKYLRQRFEQGPAVPPKTLDNTARFCSAGAQYTGLERRILVGLAEYVASKHARDRSLLTNKRLGPAYRFNTKMHANWLQGLNETMQLSL